MAGLSGRMAHMVLPARYCLLTFQLGRKVKYGTGSRRSSIVHRIVAKVLQKHSIFSITPAHVQLAKHVHLWLSAHSLLES
jgi:hypothetical protein